MALLSWLFGGGKKSSVPKRKALPPVNIAKRFELVGRTGQGSMSKVWRRPRQEHRPGRLPQIAGQGKDGQVRGPLPGH